MSLNVKSITHCFNVTMADSGKTVQVRLSAGTCKAFQVDPLAIGENNRRVALSCLVHTPL